MNSRVTKRLRTCSAARARSAVPSPRPVMVRQHRYAELGHVPGERDVRDGCERELFVVDAEYRVGVEVDTLDVLGHGRCGNHDPEAQPYIFAVEAQEMAGKPRPRAFREPLYRHVLRTHAVPLTDRPGFCSLPLGAGDSGGFNRPPPYPRAADPRRRSSHFSCVRSPASRSYAP